MSSVHDRQPRHTVSLRAQLRDASSWHEVAICNVSRQGLMLKGESVPARGTFVEIQRGQLRIVGQVRWSRGARCGVRSRDPIDLSSLGIGCASAPRISPDLIKTIVTVRQPDAIDLAAQSRRASQVFNLVLGAALALSGAYLVANLVSSTLAGPAERIHESLAGH